MHTNQHAGPVRWPGACGVVKGIPHFPDGHHQREPRGFRGNPVFQLGFEIVVNRRHRRAGVEHPRNGLPGETNPATRLVRGGHDEGMHRMIGGARITDRGADGGRLHYGKLGRTVRIFGSRTLPMHCLTPHWPREDLYPIGSVVTCMRMRWMEREAL